MTHATHHHHPHGGAHDGSQDSTEMDWERLGPYLEQEAEIEEPVLEQAAQWLHELLAPTRILDLGSGPGVATTLFARVFATAEVTAVDGTRALLDRTLARAHRLGLGRRVDTRLAELPDALDPGTVGRGDLVWASKSLHHVGDQRAAVRAAAELVRPGGVLAVAEGGLPERWLPRDTGTGRPGLQARLDAVTEDWFTAMRAELPGARDEPDDWPALLAAAGLEPVGSRTFLLDLPAPLDAAVREHLCERLARVPEMAGDRLDAEDRAAVERLLDPDDELGLRRRPDAFLLRARTVHVARRVEDGAEA
ncbi:MULTISPECIES: trans-aconitate 2-methyltransferase [Streptomyces]|uniref:Class I SAM-dependent methyltransferase n=1 Tax=Streptomyces lycii TaxID=2654337 RepID=A0ABQ7FKU0_9ACTN|nr:MULTISPECIES: class I SAM-dependent methyltransferase [Streptomyces]KAF4409572.1 class I SAM-dependent methyltransferase [Streptomyces lycii]PGH47798.1 SAM-dependent methyltransferase [Streptomyces sp. Ru87]